MNVVRSALDVYSILARMKRSGMFTRLLSQSKIHAIVPLAPNSFHTPAPIVYSYVTRSIAAMCSQDDFFISYDILMMT